MKNKLPFSRTHFLYGKFLFSYDSIWSCYKALVEEASDENPVRVPVSIPLGPQCSEPRLPSPVGHCGRCLPDAYLRSWLMNSMWLGCQSRLEKGREDYLRCVSSWIVISLKECRMYYGQGMCTNVNLTFLSFFFLVERSNELNPTWSISMSSYHAYLVPCTDTLPRIAQQTPSQSIWRSMQTAGFDSGHRIQARQHQSRPPCRLLDVRICSRLFQMTYTYLFWVLNFASPSLV